MDWIAYFLRRLDMWGLMLVGALALGGLVLVIKNFFPGMDRQTVAAFGAVGVAALIVLAMGYRKT